MRRIESRWAAVGSWLAVATLVAGARAQVTNGDFEQNAPAIAGWSELGGALSKPPGSQGTAHSVWLSPATGVPLLSGTWRGIALWQDIVHGTAQDQVAIEFDHRVGPNAQAWIEVAGPAGRLGAWLPPSVLFGHDHVTVPVGGALEVAFCAVQADAAGGGTLTDLGQVDQVVATPVGTMPAGVALTLQPWPPAPTGPREQAAAELLQQRTVASQRCTSPSGFVSTEGNTAHGYVLFSRATVTWQQVDATQIGKPIVGARSLSFRRDLSTPPDPIFASRQIELEVRMAEGDVRTLTTAFASNYVTTPTVAFARKTISAPDWTAQPPGPTPAPWDLRIPFDTPWDYDGSAALLWEIDVTQNSGAPYSKFVSYPFDADSGSGSFAPSQGPGTVLGGGCVTPGQGTGPFTLTGSIDNYVSKLQLHLAVAGAPARATVAAHFGISDPMLSSATLCAMVRATPLIVLPLGVADGSGVINTLTLDNLPYQPMLTSTPFYLQAFALDFGQPGLPVSLSNGLQVMVPADPTLPSCGYVYSFTDTPGGPSSESGPWPGGVVALIEY